jgi:hypothetical protein
MFCQQARKKRKMPRATSPMRMYSRGVSDNNRLHKTVQPSVYIGSIEGVNLYIFKFAMSRYSE